MLVAAERLGNPRAMLTVPVPEQFGRFVFACPRSDGLVLIGLTDEPYEGEPADAAEVTDEEERFLLQTISLALDRPLQSEDVVGRYAGLRPLLDSRRGGSAATADLSRRHAASKSTLVRRNHLGADRRPRGRPSFGRSSRGEPFRARSNTL